MDANNNQELDWQFLQCFGQPHHTEDVQEADLLSALEFDHTGEYLATGDRGGRVVLLEQVENNQRSQQSETVPWILPYEYQYMTEFQSHQPGFDYLKSVDIEERINVVSWLKSSTSSRLLLSANDKTVKLWKVYEKKVENLANFNTSQQEPRNNGPPPLTQIDTVADLRVPTVLSYTTTLAAKCKRVYASVHSYFINSVSVNSDQQIFLSADDLNVHLWHMDHSEESYLVVDVKPSSMNDLLEVITCACFHPSDCNTLVHASSRGKIYMCDLRSQNLSNDNAIVFQDEVGQNNNSFFSEVIASVSDVRFTPCGRFMLSRDYMHTRLWDVRMNGQPLRSFQAHEHLWNRLVDLYENEAIFDKFGCAISRDGSHVASGTYNSQLRIYNTANDNFTTLHASGDPAATQQASDNEFENLKLSWKLLHVAWHPQMNYIAAAALNSLYIFCASGHPGQNASAQAPAGK